MNLFKWLFGRKEVAVEPPPEFLQASPPDWVIDLKGRADGGAFSIRVQIATASRAGTAEVIILPGDTGGEPKTVARALQRTELDRLLVILGFSFPADIAAVTGGTAAAPRVTLTIHRREPPGEAAAECELAEWLESRKPGPPVVEIGRVLMEIKGE
jgi:hypothetical protein